MRRRSGEKEPHVLCCSEEQSRQCQLRKLFLPPGDDDGDGRKNQEYEPSTKKENVNLFNILPSGCFDSLAGFGPARMGEAWPGI